MKRTFAVIGFTMLGTLAVFCNINNQTAVSVALLASLAVLLFSIIFYAFKKNKTLVAVSVCVFISLCALQLCNEKYNNQKMLYCDKNVNITATLNALPYFENGRHYYPVETSTVDGEKQKISVRIVSASPLDFEPYDEITVSVNTYLLGKSDGSFVNYYRSRAMIFGGYLNKGDSAEITKNTNHGITQLLLMLRSKMCQSIMYVLPNDYGAVLCSIMLGEKSQLSGRAENAFRISGVSHLFAVSGLHLSVWSMLIFDFLRKLRLSTKKASVFSICFCLFFMLLTGLNPPVVRAGFMMLFMYASGLFSRESDSFNSIGLAVSVMLLANPYAALSISLWLSLLATMGILILGRPVTSGIIKLIDKAFSKRITDSNKFLYAVVSILGISLAVSIFTLPVYIFKFNNISSLMLLSNLLMVSVGTLCMELAGVASVLTLVHLEFLGKPLTVLAGLISKFLFNTALTLSSFRYALIPVNSIASKICFAVIIATVLLFLIFKINSKKYVKVCAFTLALAFIITNASVYAVNFNTLKLRINSSESGTGIIMQYKGRNIAFCNDLDSFEQYELSRSISNSAVSTVDCLVLPDCQSTADASLNKVIKDFNVRNLLVPAGCELAPTDIKAQTGFFDGSEISVIPDELNLNINKNYAVIDFFDTKIVIYFKNDIILNNSDADIVFFAGSVPESFTADGYKLCIFGFGDYDGEKIISADSKSIELSVKKNSEFTYRRAENA